MTNAILEGTLASTALVTTKCFRDVLEIGRHLRLDMYDLNKDKPIAIVPRDMRFEVDERMAPDGTVLTALDATSLASAIEALKGTSAQAIAVSYLHSYANPDLEIETLNALQVAFPDSSI